MQVIDITKYSDYRLFLKDVMTERRMTSPRLTQSYFAHKASIQRTYLSHVMALRAHLSSDQLFSLREALNLGLDVQDDLQLMLEIAKCNVRPRLEILKSQLADLRAKRLSSENYLSPSTRNAETSERYYRDPYMPIIHMMLLVPAFAKHQERIPDSLKISADRAATLIAALIEMGLVAREKTGLKVLSQQIHLPQSHPAARSHAIEMRQLGIGHRMTSDNEQDLFFTATIAADRECVERAKRLLLECIGAISKEVENSDSHEVVQLNIDLFPIAAP